MRKRAKRIYGILLCMSMLLTLLSVPAWAAEPVETGVGYELEQEQQQGQTQNPEHEHTQGCYMLIENCVHEHTLECYPQTTGADTVSGNDVMENVEDQPTECTHVCSEERGCISRRLSCPFEKESSGELQEETLEGSSGINVENVLKANELPIVKAPNNSGVKELTQANIIDYKQSVYTLPSGNYRLGEDITLDGEIQIVGTDTSVSLDLNGHKLEMGNNQILQAYSTELVITNTSQQDGRLITGSKKGIQIGWDAKLKIYGGTIDSIITYLGNAEFYLYGGTIKQNVKFDDNISWGAFSNAVLYANGGIVEGDLSIRFEGLTIRTDVDPVTSTTFMGDVQNCKIEGGIFKGSVENCTIADSAKVTVTFDSQGGNKIVPQRILLLRGQNVSDPGTPVCEGYIFDGWMVGGNPYEIWNFNDGVTDTMGLLAKWKAVYKVALNTNNGTIAAGKEIKSYIDRTQTTLPTKADITRDGYTFEGWYTDSGFSGSPVTEITSTDTGDKTFWAKWTANTYTVKLETNGGKIAAGKDVTAYTCGTGAALPGGGDITREGYTFEGWYEDSSFSGSPVTEITSADTGNKTFYAKWKPNIAPVTPVETEPKDTNHENISRNNINSDNTDYYDTGDTNESTGSGSTAPVIYPTLTFDTCGGSSIKQVRAFEGHTIYLSGYLPTREGYQFSGWYADQNLTQPVTEIRLNGNRTVYAGWIKQAEQAGESSKPKAAPAQLIVNDNEKTANKDSSQPLIEDYEPGSTDTPEDQITEDQSPEDTGDNQKPAVDNSPADNDSEPDDSADLAPENNSHSGGWIPVICISAGALVIGFGTYLGYRRRKKIDKK
ncbi:MAG: InlB B-repeat-containing protein [Lachnospiraceae bacterium]|nr:InlB B-repeat-containing protein [Lachnospiraceae bacterium]